MAAGSSAEPRLIASGHHIRLLERGGWEYADRARPAGIVFIAALTEGEELLLVEQFRPPVDRRVIELPAGLVGDEPGWETESLLEGARRELIEETGYDARDWSEAATGAPSAGISTEVLTLFIARGLERVGPGGGSGEEEITVHEVPFGEVPSWLERERERGAVIDLKIYAGLYFLARPAPRVLGGEKAP